jgi:histidinol-phosphate phosphatase family protein
LTVWKSNITDPADEPRPALFLDRDGVVIADRNYLADPELVQVISGVPAALRTAADAGYLLIGVSNQSGIGRGYFSEEDFHRVMVRLESLLAADGVAFDAFLYCPHAPDAGCDCRKPRPGLLEEARRLHRIDTAGSWMIGDKASDVTFGREAGMGSVLVRTGYGAGEEDGIRRRYSGDDHVLVAADLPAAVALILGRRGGLR